MLTPSSSLPLLFLCFVLSPWVYYYFYVSVSTFMSPVQKYVSPLGPGTTKTVFMTDVLGLSVFSKISALCFLTLIGFG